MSELARGSYRDELLAACVAGFDASDEGRNGEYAIGCHNVPRAGHQHTPELLAQLEREFEDWWRRDG